MMLAHNVHDVQSLKRHVHANRLNGIDNEWLTPEQAKAFCPPLNISPDIRYPVLGAALQRRGGMARHDAVAWGYARGADALGVDIIQNCEVTGIRRGADGAVAGVETTRGLHRAPSRSASSPPATPAWSWRMAGVRMPLESYPAAGAGVGAGQAGVPVRGDVQHDPRLHQPVRQGRAGDRRRHRPVRLLQPAAAACTSPTHTLEAICELFPIFSPHADAAQLGRHRRRHARPLADHRRRRRSRASTSIAAGAPAASRRRRARATCSPHTIAKDEPHPINAALHARPLPHRPPDRRGGRRRRRALRATPMLLIPCPYCGAAPRDRVPLRRRGAHRPARRPARGRRRGLGGVISSTAPTRRACMPSAGSTPTAAGAGSTRCATR